MDGFKDKRDKFKGSLMESDTLLLRQIHPNFFRNNRLTSQAFRPTPKDDKKLSVYDGDLINSQKAYNHYTQDLALPSIGVMAVSVNECNSIQLTAKPDPTPFPEHAIIDFSPYSRDGERETLAKKLRGCAEKRNWQYKP